MIMSFVLIVKAKLKLANHVFVSFKQPAIIHTHRPYLHDTLVKHRQVIS
jgi:hypothetical protein